MAKVTVEGSGTFEINNEKIGELLAWLAKNQGVHIQEKNVVQEVKNDQFTGRTLLEG